MRPIVQLAGLQDTSFQASTLTVAMWDAIVKEGGEGHRTLYSFLHLLCVFKIILQLKT